MKTKNLAVSILAALLVLAVWYQYLLKPTRSQASKVRAETATDRAKLAPLQRQLDQARADDAHKSTLAAQLAALQLAVPNSPALAAFVRDANQIAAASGVSWQSVTHALPTPSLGGVETITVGIQVKGTYEQVLDYVGRLAGIRRLLVVDSVQLNTSSSTGAGAPSDTGSSTGPFTGASKLSATISGRMFVGGAAAASSATGSGSSTASASTGTASSGSGSAHPSTLNNS